MARTDGWTCPRQKRSNCTLSTLPAPTPTGNSAGSSLDVGPGILHAAARPLVKMVVTTTSKRRTSARLPLTPYRNGRCPGRVVGQRRGGGLISDGQPNTPLTGWDCKGPGSRPAPTRRAGREPSAPIINRRRAPTTARDRRSLGPLTWRHGHHGVGCRQRRQSVRRSRASKPQDGIRGPWFDRRLREPSFVIPETVDCRRQRVAAADSGCCKSLPNDHVRSYRYTVTAITMRARGLSKPSLLPLQLHVSSLNTTPRPGRSSFYRLRETTRHGPPSRGDDRRGRRRAVG